MNIGTALVKKQLYRAAFRSASGWQQWLDSLTRQGGVSSHYRPAKGIDYTRTTILGVPVECWAPQGAWRKLVYLHGGMFSCPLTDGYRWVAAYIRTTLKTKVSDNFVYKCFRYLGIKSETRHRHHYKARKVKDRYPNLILSTWDTVDRPRQVIVSDMTALKFWLFYFELTFYFDVFTKEILTWRLADRKGSREQYVDGLQDVVDMLKGSHEPTVLHTDQGSVYASLAYNELIKDTLIVRSMS